MQDTRESTTITFHHRPRLFLSYFTSVLVLLDHCESYPRDAWVSFNLGAGITSWFIPGVFVIPLEWRSTPSPAPTAPAPAPAPLLTEPVFGLLVWTLIGGTEYLHIPALGWVMFVSVFYWVLTVILFLIYLTMAHTRIPQIPWTILGICFNGSASVLYLTAAVICAISLNVAIRERYYFISWVASTIFASLAMVSYAENTVVNFKSWRSKSEET